MTTQNNVSDYQNQMLAALDARLAYEIEKNSDTRFDRHIKEMRKTCEREAIATTLQASNVDAQYINRHERTNVRYNIYAAQKVNNIAQYLNNVAMLNHYTLAVFRTAHALEANEMTLAHKDAIAACSADCKHSNASREKIIKTTRYASHVAANTASTQSSSSINALQTLNVLIESRDDANNVIYKLNRESHACKALAENLAITL
jgi:hypothetical protein